MRARRLSLSLIALSAVLTALATSPASDASACPSGMAFVVTDDVKPFCIDRWEAAVVELDGKRELPHHAWEPVTNLRVKAVSHSGVFPQGYISKNEAEAACKNARKRLCSGDEWSHACRGKKPTVYPYGDDYKAGYCNDSGRAPIAALHPELVGDALYASNEAMNDPRINQAENTVSKTGAFAKCKNGFGVHDMVGNLHEWTADIHDGTRGTFRGGYYQDTHLNGDGCSYRTMAHDVSYHDYSTGFRCCADAR